MLIVRALSTDGCCYCRADCETAVRHQSKSKSLHVSSSRHGFHFYVILCNQRRPPVLFADVSIRLFKNSSLHFLLNSLFLSLTECAFTSSINTYTSMTLKFILCSQSLCSTYQLSRGLRTTQAVSHANLSFKLYCFCHICTCCRLCTHPWLINNNTRKTTRHVICLHERAT